MMVTNFTEFAEAIHSKAIALATENNSLFKIGDEKIIEDILSHALFIGGLPYMQQISTKVFYIGKDFNKPQAELSSLLKNLDTKMKSMCKQTNLQKGEVRI